MTPAERTNSLLICILLLLAFAFWPITLGLLAAAAAWVALCFMWEGIKWVMRGGEA